MRILALDAALSRCSATVVIGSQPVAGQFVDGPRGHEVRLPAMTRAVLEQSGLAPSALDLIAVTVGPGSFTGIRAGLALAQGIGLALGKPLVAVTVPEALASSLNTIGPRELWTAIDSRRGSVFLDHRGVITGYDLGALPIPESPVAIAGDAAIAVAARLAAREVNVMLTDARLPIGRHVALVAERRFTGKLSPLTARPLYIDPAQARPAIQGLRPPPVV